MIPTSRTLVLAIVLFMLGVVVAIVGLPAVYWDGALGLCLGVLIFDASVAALRAKPRLDRELPNEFSQGQWAEIGLRVENRTGHRLNLGIFDHFPVSGEYAELPIELYVPPNRGVLGRYQWQPRERGMAAFGAIEARIDSPLRFWRRTVRIDAAAKVKVFPAMSGLRQAALKARQRTRSQAGESRRRHRGNGSEFLQLREYEPGDPVSRIDWRATARTRQLVAREYLDEREQRIIFMLDCGRRMRSRDGMYSHFDQALSALMKLAFVASRHSDAVGAMGFGVQSEVSQFIWVPPRRGRGAIRAILNGFYDVQPGLAMPDFEHAITQMLRAEKREALVVLISNVRDEDSELLAHSLAALGKRHRVLLANLRESVLDEIHSGDGAIARESEESRLLLTSVARYYDDRRQQLLTRLSARGAWVIDTEPANLGTQLINAYIAIKTGARRSGGFSGAASRRLDDGSREADRFESSKAL